MLRAARPFVVMTAMALIQVSILDQVRLFGFVHLDIVLWSALAAGLTLAPTESIKLGFFGGLVLDFLGPSYLGRQALALCLAAWVISLLAPRMLTAGTKVGWLERSVLLMFCSVFVWLTGSVTALAFPLLDLWFLPGLAVSAAIGAVVSAPRLGLGRLFGPHETDLRFNAPKLPANLTLEPEPT